MVYYDMYGNPVVVPTPTNTAQMNYQQNCQCDNRFMWVPSKEVARTMPMAPDKTILFLDENTQYQYLRKTDKEGKTIEFRSFKLVEEEEPKPKVMSTNDNYISKEEFNLFSKNIDTSLNELKEMILSSQRHNKPYKKEVRENG